MKKAVNKIKNLFYTTKGIEVGNLPPNHPENSQVFTIWWMPQARAREIIETIQERRIPDDGE